MPATPVPPPQPRAHPRTASTPIRLVHVAYVVLRPVGTTVIWILVALMVWTLLDVLGLLAAKTFPNNQTIADISGDVDTIWWGTFAGIDSVVPDWITVDPRHLHVPGL